MNELASKELFDADVANLARLAAIRGWTLHEVKFPVIDVSFHEAERRPLRVRLVANNWNELPPSVELRAADGTFLKTGEAPAQAIFHQGPHPATNRPFVCMVGTVEYHTHSSHLTDYWENYRKGEHANLSSLLTQIWSAWLHASK